ncbi:MAG TPA: glucose-6-phosphate dehydrogenase assembly protein OpcA, partial [Candidatus Melainabacteria bacterium]|nr:glucose-6-phosphate dehydrogenase assembly protein OpcA [Candidatus Melainabacteria bacterium]
SFDIKRGHLEIEDLDSISSVEIIEENGTDDGDGKVTAQSWLFLGWLASRLSWQFDRIEAADSNNPEAPTTIYYRLNRTAIKVKLRRYRDPQNHDNKGRLREIRIKLRNEEHSVLRVWPDSVSPGLRTALLNAHGNIDDEDISHNPKSQIDLIDSILNDPVKPRTFEEAVDAACAVLRRMRAK